MIIAFCILIILCVMFGEKQNKIPTKDFLIGLGIFCTILILIFFLPMAFLYLATLL